MSQKTRRLRLGMADVDNYVKRFETECGDVVNRFATENELKEININVSEFSDVEELIQKISEIIADEQLYKIVLCGKRKFDINIQKIIDIISAKNLIKIKDETVIGYDVDKIAKENSLRGYFVREVLEHKNEYSNEEIEKAIEIGLENL